jgi:diacylglycerol kinase family enzyme
MSTHLLVGNPTAQSGKSQECMDQALNWLKARGISCDFLATEPEGKTIDTVTHALDMGDHRCVVYMGGDGTFREVASGLLASRRVAEVSMGMLPTGTANDQGRSFGLEAGEDALLANLSVVLAGKETRLDAGKITAFSDVGVAQSAHFFDSAGWGISARVLFERNQDREWVQKVPMLKGLYRDQLVYAGALLRVFLESFVVSDKFSARVVADGVTHDLDDLTDLIIKGTRVYGGAWVFDRTSAHDDGKFEVVPFRGKRDWTNRAIVDLDGNPFGTENLSAAGVEHSKPFSAQRVELTFGAYAGASALHAQIDGEEFPATPRVIIEVIPRAIRLIVP